MEDNIDFSFRVGQIAEDTINITEDHVDSFAKFSGDYNPLHVDQNFAGKTSFRQKVAHGMSYGALFSKLIGMLLPGPGALWASQNFNFERPAFIGDRLSLKIEIMAVNETTRRIVLKCTAHNQNGDQILSGTGEVLFLEVESEVEPEKIAKDNIALVIGGSKGIGAAIVRRLCQDGYKVAFTYSASTEAADLLAAELDNCLAIQADASKIEEASRVVYEVSKKFGEAPDNLVFCASGSGLYGAAADGSFDLYARHLKVQFEATHAFVSLCLDRMIKKRHGTLTAISSSYTKGAPPTGMAPYIVAKAALTAYFQCLAVEYGPMGIRANIVSPGMTDTGLISRMPDRQRKVVAAQNPLRRLGHPVDVANAVSYLISDEAGYMNGHDMIISGGSVM